MKKLLAILLSILLLCACVPLGAIPVMAATSGTTGDCTWTLDDDGHLTISGNGKMGNHSSSSLPWGTSITSVTIDEGVTAIGDNAFYECLSLMSVTIPDSVTTIGDRAFCYNASLASVTIPDSVTTLGNSAFFGCFALVSVTIPGSVTAMGNWVFYSCDSLSSVTIGEGVTTISNYAFGWCTSLTSVTIGNSLATIGDDTFSFCRSLTDVYYAGTVADRANIAIANGNDSLLNATWHYNQKQETPDGAVSLEGMPIVDYGSYQGNEGDSTVFNLNGKGLSQNNDGYTFNRYGNVGVDGTVFYHGFEVWIARWNGIPEISWAYATFDIGGAYTTLTGKTGLIDSYNTDYFDTTVYFYDGDILLASYRLTESDYQKDISVDVTGVQQLKMYVEDNVAVEGGTSLALYDMFLSGDGVVAPAYTFGDVNADGRVNNKDLGLLQRYLAGWDVEIVLAAAGVNNDGHVNNKDFGLLQQYLAGWDVTLG